MKVLSLLQPWASLVVLGAKKIETRCWSTKFRGPLLIHASLGKKPAGRHIAKLAGEFGIKKPAFDDLPFGAIIGGVNLIDTVEIMEITKWISSPHTLKLYHHKKTGKTWPITDQEISFGDYSPGRFGWLLSDPVQFANPIPAKGALSLWEFDMPDHIHIPNKYGGHATFNSPPTAELLAAVNNMADLAYKMKR